MPPERPDRKPDRKRLYAAITGDVIGSTELAPAERRRLQKRLLELTAEMNREFADDVVVDLSVSRGDTVQGLLTSTGRSFDLALAWADRFYPWKMRFGIGHGGLVTPLGATTAAMDGECLRRSGSALERAKEEGLSFLVETESPLLDQAVRAILRLVYVIQRDWKELHHRRFALYRLHGDFESVSRVEKTRREAIWKSLSRANYKAVIQSYEDVARLLLTCETPLVGKGAGSPTDDL